MPNFDNPNGVSRTETGREVPPQAAGLSGDFDGSAGYIVPHYHETGHKTRQGMPMSSKATERMERIMSKYGERMQIPVAIDATVPTGKSTKRKSKPKTTVVQSKSKDADLPLPSYAVQETPQPGFLNPTLATKPNIVVFNLKLGKIKVVVDAVLETDIGLALVFADENEVRFTPEQGNDLKLTLPGNKDIEVMYLGITFNWYNTKQQVMTFIKSEV